MLTSMIINSLVQLLAFCLIPFIWWVVTTKRKESFFYWIGLHRAKVDNTRKLIIYGAVILVALLLPGMYLSYTFENKAILAGARFANTGIEGLFSLLVFAVIQTGLAEEIFFRGFLTKRISSKLGVLWGSIIQAAFFGLLHGVIFLNVISPLIALSVVMFTFMAGYFMAHINERIAGGSILPSFIIHSLVNIISSLMFWTGAIPVQ